MLGGFTYCSKVESTAVYRPSLEPGRHDKGASASPGLPNSDRDGELGAQALCRIVKSLGLLLMTQTCVEDSQIVRG